MAAPSSDPSFVGIDPGATGALINAITSKVPSAKAAAERYKAQFSQLGVSTAPIGALLSDYSWATGAQGVVMLRRRQGLAEHQPPGDFLKGTDWTTAGAGTLTFATDAAAAKAGKAEGQRLLSDLQKAKLDDPDDPAVQAALKTLQAHSNDAAYTAALFTALGPNGMELLAGDVYGNSSAGAKNITRIVGAALTTASYGMSKAQALALVTNSIGNIPVDPGGTDQNKNEITGLALAPFLSSGGKFSDQFLDALSKPLTDDPNISDSDWLGPDSLSPSSYSTSAIWTAFANNPQFAAQFYHQHAALIRHWMTGDTKNPPPWPFPGPNPDRFYPMTDNAGFGKFLISATNAPKGDESPLYEQNFKDFFGTYDSKVSTNAPAPVRQAMAVDAVTHFNDLKAAVTAAAPGAKSPLGLSANQWGMFAQNAMKDKSAAAFLIGAYAHWRNSLPGDNIAQDGAGDNNTTPDYAGYWHHGSIGMLDYFFASNYNAAGATAGHTNQSLLVALDTAASVIGPMVAVGLTLGPEADIPAFLFTMANMEAPDAIPVGTILGSGASSKALQLVVNYAAKYGLIDAVSGLATTPGKSPGQLGGTLVNVQKNWAGTVATTWNGSGSKPGHPNFLSGPGVQVDSKGTSYIQYNGRNYTGDPLAYEKQYNGYFMDSNGNIKSTAKMTPAELRAYNAWLQDPAVSFQNAAAFRGEGDGAAFEYVQHALSGGNGSGGGGSGIGFNDN